MKVLGIETSSSNGSVAVAEGGVLIAELSVNLGPKKSEELVPMIDYVLGLAGLSRGELEGIAVSSGPGFFTALRVGLSTAKSLAYFLRVPIAGVSSLDALALNVFNPGGTVCPVIDLRRGEVAASFLRHSRGGDLEPLGKEFVTTPDGLIGLAPDGTVFTGAVDGIRELIEGPGNGGRGLTAAPDHYGIPRAASCCVLGGRRLERGSEDDPMGLVPHYAREMEAG